MFNMAVLQIMAVLILLTGLIVLNGCITVNTVCTVCSPDNTEEDEVELQPLGTICKPLRGDEQAFEDIWNHGYDTMSSACI